MNMVDKEQILRLTNGGLDVFSYYLGIPVNVHRNFKSPFYEDKHASCHIYFDKRTSSYKFYDHGDTTYSGDCFWFVSTLNHMNIKTDFPLVLKKIVEDLGLSSISCRMEPQCHSNLKERQNPPLCFQSEDDYHPFRYDTKPFDSGTLAYWQHYGISKEILKNIMSKTCPYMKVFLQEEDRLLFKVHQQNHYLPISVRNISNSTVQTVQNSVSFMEERNRKIIVLVWSIYPVKGMYCLLLVGKRPY